MPTLKFVHRVLNLLNEILHGRIRLQLYSQKQFVKRENKNLDFSAGGRNLSISKTVAGYLNKMIYLIYPIICYDLVAESSCNTTI